MLLDFKEIPQANTGSGLQDTFELFTRDFLQYLGYRILENPNRGADGKKDMIVEEVFKGVSSEHTVRWLVSCKHFAHAGASVKDRDEINIADRLKQHSCDGFMGVYSTLPSTSLSGLLTGQPNRVIYDHEKIESLLLRDSEGQIIAARYFPESYKKYQIENPVPAKIFADSSPICCEVCGNNLLDGSKQGIYVCLEPWGDIEDQTYEKRTEEIHFVCKGKCDQKFSRLIKDKYRDTWNDINDLKNPTLWISLLMAFLNGIFYNHELSEEAFKTMKQMFIRTYPYVARHLTSKEKEQVKNLLMFGELY